MQDAQERLAQQAAGEAASGSGQDADDMASVSKNKVRTTLLNTLYLLEKQSDAKEGRDVEWSYTTTDDQI